MMIHKISSLSSKVQPPSPTRPVQRAFQFIPYGEFAPTQSTTITCDGRVPGATLEVTHWTGNDTPDILYADTSTEMAIKLLEYELEGNDDQNNRGKAPQIPSLE
jgi:hypothetical protein